MTDFPSMSEEEIPNDIKNRDPMFAALMSEDTNEETKEIIEVFAKVIQLDMDSIEDMLEEINHRETVGPLMNPGNWKGNAFDDSQRAKQRLRKLRDLKKELMPDE